MTVKQISALELQEKLQQSDNFVLLDVREPDEYEIARIGGSTLLPLNQLPQRHAELNPQQEVVVLCHHGIRSQQAASYLQHIGFNQVSNVVGGIDAWSCECDSSVRRY